MTDISIPRDEFIKEHKHLISLLNKYNIPELKQEAKGQAKELKKMRGGVSARDFSAMNRALRRQEAVAPKYEYKEPEFRKTATGAKGFFETFGQVLKPISQGVKAVGDITGIQPISKLGQVGETASNVSAQIGERVGGSNHTHRQQVLKRLGLKDEPHSIAELSKASGVPRKILLEVYKRGVGAYKTQPKSVRLKGSFVKNVDAPMSKKLSKEQWGMSRVYSFLNGNPAHDNDLRKNKELVGGFNEDYHTFLTVLQGLVKTFLVNNERLLEPEDEEAILSRAKHLTQLRLGRAFDAPMSKMKEDLDNMIENIYRDLSGGAKKHFGLVG